MGKPLLGGQAMPLHGLGIVVCHAQAVGSVPDAEVVLRAGVSHARRPSDTTPRPRHCSVSRPRRWRTWRRGCSARRRAPARRPSETTPWPGRRAGGTPWPLAYMTPRRDWARACPCAASALNSPQRRRVVAAIECLKALLGVLRFGYNLHAAPSRTNAFSVGFAGLRLAIGVDVALRDVGGGRDAKQGEFDEGRPQRLRSVPREHPGTASRRWRRSWPTS